MNSQVEVFEGEADVVRELAALQAALTVEGLLQVLGAGVLAQGQTTPNDSPCWRGAQPRGYMIRAIRDWLCPLGWDKSDVSNLALVEHRAAGIAIAITPGDHNTGLPGHNPKSRTPRGEVTIGKVELNQMSFMEQLLGPDAVRNSSRLWVFLFNIQNDIARAELSFPLAVGDDDRIVAWRTRLLLPNIQFGRPDIQVRPEDEPLPDVQVRRKAKE
jgi:hypothetical protein